MNEKEPRSVGAARLHVATGDTYGVQEYLFFSFYKQTAPTERKLALDKVSNNYRFNPSESNFIKLVVQIVADKANGFQFEKEKTICLNQ